MGSPTLQTLQYPILLPPWVCFRGGFPNPNGRFPGDGEQQSVATLAQCRSRRADALFRAALVQQSVSLSDHDGFRWRKERERKRER
jgi:hypothetical protein